MKRVGVALALTLGAAALGYALLLGLGSVVGSWSLEVIGQQARALLLHFVVIGVRGLVPGILLTAAGFHLLIGRAGLGEGAATGVAALLAAALITPTVLSSGIGGLPQLAIHGPVNMSASVLLLALASGAGWLGAGRLARARPGSG